MTGFAEQVIASRAPLMDGMRCAGRKAAEEGGCGVVGFASSVPVRGRHIFEPSIQMHNRGNGKGGGIAAACLTPAQLGVDDATLRDDYLVQIALLDGAAERDVEREFILPYFRIAHREKIEPAADWRGLGLEVRPPDVVRYFARVKPEILAGFARESGLAGAPSARAMEDEFVYRNSFKLNNAFYASLGEKRAFVLCHGRDLMVFKIVGYAEDVVRYYGLENAEARIWIAHQRYPTKGRVWHPAGSHPFVGLNEALVHNGDFANYFGITQYLRQHNIAPQFLTDTEVAVQLFDLWRRVYGYPIECVMEAMAPTTEMDFELLPAARKKTYRAVQAAHMHGSPDGPWFFIIACSEPDDGRYRLIGITDTSMLRPQVFALQEGGATIGLVASEKQAIDATLHSLSREDPRFRPVADRYWNARGGSHTDGGAFEFAVTRRDGRCEVRCADKFGRRIAAPPGKWTVNAESGESAPESSAELAALIGCAGENGAAVELFSRVERLVAAWDFGHLRWLTRRLERRAADSARGLEAALEVLALLNDRRYDCGGMKRSAVLQIVRKSIDSVLDAVPRVGGPEPGPVRRIDWAARESLAPPVKGDTTLVVLARDFPPEGDDCDARLLVKACELGWKRFVVYGLKGQRFTGCGFGPETSDVRIDVFGSSGDYLASGMDGMEIRVHGNGQDQLGQIIKGGTLVVYGDVGQAFMYGAKGGDVYVMGNAAGRPLINAAGRPRVVINGTCLDFLAESFMAGDPHNGGGFVILNGMEFDDRGRVRELESPYPGSNLFSLASGGAIFVRDPRGTLNPGQLNGGEFAEFTDRDWALIEPHLRANERHFGISVERDLLTVGGVRRAPEEVFRKVRAVKLAVLAREEPPE